MAAGQSGEGGTATTVAERGAGGGARAGVPGFAVRMVVLLVVAGWVASYGWPVGWEFGTPGAVGWRVSVGHGWVQVYRQWGWFTAGGPGLGAGGSGYIPPGQAGVAMAGPVIAAPPGYSMNLAWPGSVSVATRWGPNKGFLRFPVPDARAGSAGLFISGTTRLPLGTWGTGPVANVGYWSVGVPVWGAVVMVLGMWGVRALWRWRNVEADVCLGCGYDLRATPERCPECGREV